MVFHNRAILYAFQVHIKAPQPVYVTQDFVGFLAQGHAVHGNVSKGQGAVAPHIHIPHLDVGFPITEIVLPRQFLAQIPVARLVVDGGHPVDVFLIVVLDREEFQIPHYLGREKLLDKALVLEVLHREMQGFQPVAAGDVGEPFAVLVSRVLADPAQVREDRESEGVGVEARIPGAVERRLIHHG